MTKKNYVCKNKENIQEIIGWTAPKLHQASECYVSFKVFDPCYGKLRLKKIMLGHIKGKRNQRVYGEALIKRITQKLLEGWNPWVEESSREEYALFSDVCNKYREYLERMVKEGGIKPGTRRNYAYKLSFLLKWLDSNEQITYVYQFNKTLISKFLDYILVSRNDALRTRNNYIGWLKSFSSYLVERGYVPRNPAEGISITTKLKHKNREVIPNDVLRQLKSYLTKENKHYLLACYFLHYLFIRPGEMCSLKIRDISHDKKTLSLSGSNTKNGRDAVVTIPKHVVDLMEELGIFRKSQNFYIFGNDFRPGIEPIKAKIFSTYWDKNVRKALNLSSAYKFYSLKDTGITNMIKSKTDLLSVRDQARHSSVDVTNVYTPQDCKEANSALIDYEGVF